MTRKAVDCPCRCRIICSVVIAASASVMSPKTILMICFCCIVGGASSYAAPSLLIYLVQAVSLPTDVSLIVLRCNAAI